MERAIGIDLGTAYTCAAIFRNGHVEIIPDPDDGSLQVPSCVAFTDTSRLVGSAAKRQATSNPFNTVFNAMRFVGRKFVEALQDVKLSSAQVVDIRGRPVFQVEHLGETKRFHPEAIIAMIISRVKRNAEIHLGGEVQGAVFTVPNFFSQSQRQSIRDAAQIAGIEVINLFSGSVAASMDHAFHTPYPGERNVLFVDLGASTLDVTLIIIEGGIIQVRSVASVLNLGGEDFDLRIMNHMINIFKRRTGNDISGASRSMARLRKACEKAKCELSSQLETSIQIDSLYAGLDFYYPLKRNDVTEVCKDLFRSVLEPIERVLRDGKLDKSSLHEIALLGGSSRIVPIQELLAEIFPGKLISKILNPVESPARGVALQAAKCTRDGDVRPLNEMLLLNVYPFPLGFDKGDGLMEVLLRRNTTIPTKKTYRYSTWQDNQGSFYLTALEGFRARPKDNNKLGQLAIPVPINPRGVPQIDVTYDVDAQGRLAVELKDVNTGVTGKMALQDYDRLKPDEIEQMQLEAEKLDASDQLEINRQEVKITLEGNAIKFKNRLLDGNLSNSMPFWRVCGILAWLEENEHADTAKLESKQAELQKLATFVERRSTPRVYADQSATTDSTKVESMHELPGVESPKPETFDFLRDNPHFDQFRHHVQQVPNMLERLLAEIAKINPPMAQLIADHDEEFLQLLAEDHPIRSYPNSDVDIAAWADIRVPINLGSGGREPESVSAVVDRWIKSAVKEVPTSGSSRNVPVSEEPSLNAPTSSTTGTTPEPPTKGPTSAPRAAYVEDYNSEDASQSLGVQPNVSDQRDAAAPSSTQPSIHAAIPPEPTTRTEPEASTSGSETVSSEVGLGDIFTSPSTGSNRTQYSDAEFNQITTYLRNTGRPAWSLVPRLYTVLRVIGQLPFLDRFIEQGITDIFFPFTTASLPAVMTPSSRASFLQIQTAVLSKSLKFEKSSERRHALFGPGEPLPFEVVGRLGAGAHGSVDKVVSTVSHREYARKLFRRTRGVSRDEVKSFLLELQVLKRVSHIHCVELVQSYTDPRHFALIMVPVADYNLFDYYSIAAKDSDKLSLLRSFFGCLASALAYIHDIKIRHRDIKPQNVLVKGDRVFLTDFGIALDWEQLSRSTTTADSGKTWPYAAPEVARYEKRNTSSDVWSLGCVFLEMVTVLKGSTVGDMRHFFKERSDNYRFYANIANLPAWKEKLWNTGAPKDDKPLIWVEQMLQETAELRPTAAKLYEDIAAESAAFHIPFCGPCCNEEEDSPGFGEEEDDDEMWGYEGEPSLEQLHLA